MPGVNLSTDLLWGRWLGKRPLCPGSSLARGGPSLAQHGDPCETPSLPWGWGFLLLSKPPMPCSIKGPGSCGSQPGMPGSTPGWDVPCLACAKPHRGLLSSFGAQACSHISLHRHRGSPRTCIPPPEISPTLGLRRRERAPTGREEPGNIPTPLQQLPLPLPIPF